MEDHALWRRSAKRQTKLSGVRAREETEGGVKITDLSDSFYASRYVGARRIF